MLSMECQGLQEGLTVRNDADENGEKWGISVFEGEKTMKERQSNQTSSHRK